MKKYIIYILLIFGGFFNACETYEIPQSQTETSIQQKRIQNTISIYVNVIGKGEVYVVIDGIQTTVKQDESISFEVPLNKRIHLSINDNSEDSFGGWYVSGNKVTSGWTYEIDATPDLDIQAVFGKILTLNITGPGTIKVNDMFVNKSMCPYSLFLGGDETFVYLEEIPSDNWYISSITDEKGNTYTDYIDMSTSKKVEVVFCEITRYLRVIESPQDVEYNDYNFTISGYEYLDTDYANPQRFAIESLGVSNIQNIADYIQSRGIALTFSNTSGKTLKVEITFNGTTREYSVDGIEYIELKSSSHQEDRLINLEIQISKY